MMVISATFDPITVSEVEYLKQYRKTEGLKDLYVSVEDTEGILSVDERYELLKLALKPYRHLHAIKGIDGIHLDRFKEEEEAVRNGYYRKAAHGIRQTMFAKGYYFTQTMLKMCKPNRAAHSIRVAETARKIAKYHHVDEKSAYHAGLLHDITKAFSDDVSREIIRLWKPEWLDISPKVWHSYTAAHWMRENMLFYDNEILHAIEHHTFGDGHSELDHILYIADKIEPGRGYDTSVQMHLACCDLHACDRLIHEESAAYRKKESENGTSGISQRYITG